MCRSPSCTRRRQPAIRRKIPRSHRLSLRAQAGWRRTRTGRSALRRHMPIALTFLWRELSGRAGWCPAACLDCLVAFLRLVLVRFPCGIAVLVVGEGCRERSGGDGCQEYCEDDAFHRSVPFWLIDDALWHRLHYGANACRADFSARYGRHASAEALMTAPAAVPGTRSAHWCRRGTTPRTAPDT